VLALDLRPVLLLAIAASACAANQAPGAPPPADPLVVPTSVALETEEDLRAHQDEAVACMQWLLKTHPSAEPQTWTSAQDFALDWMEKAPFVDAKPTGSILDRIEDDTHFFYSMYMRTAYLSARTLYWLEHPDGNPVDAEIAAIDGMRTLFEVFKSGDPRAKSRGLKKYEKLQKRGKLEAYLAKQLSK
jgi:hypothetical protein